MANNYKPGKFAGRLTATLQGDPEKQNETLGDNFDSELNNLKQAQNKIDSYLSDIKKQANSLYNDKETGKLLRGELKQAVRNIGALQNELTTAMNGITAAITKAQRAEYSRMKKEIAELQAALKTGGSQGTEGSSTSTATATTTTSTTDTVATTGSTATADTAATTGTTATADTTSATTSDTIRGKYPDTTPTNAKEAAVWETAQERIKDKYNIND